MKHQWIGRVLGLSSLVSLAACDGGTRADPRPAGANVGGHGGSAPTGGALGGSVQGSAGGMLELGGSASVPSGGADTDGDTCVAVTEDADLNAAIDIIIVIDNSGSMGEEIAAVEERINDDFAAIIAASGVDYRVIMLSELRSKEPVDYVQGICVGPPLGGHVCEGTSADAVNAERYFPYQSFFDDKRTWCRMLDTFTRPDPTPFSLCSTVVFPSGFGPRDPIAPNGWQTHLRAGVFKSFVTITDDDVDCRRETEVCGGELVDESLSDGSLQDPSAKPSPEDKAAAFDRKLLALSADHFGTQQKRNYRYHSITGIEADGVVAPSEPLIDEGCPTAPNSGTSYQALSRLTGGLRFSVCQNQSFDAIFQQLAADAIESAQLNCDWPIPDAPASETFDPAKVNVQYRQGGGTTGTTIAAVESPADCGSEPGWYYDDNASPERIFVCPATCDALRSDRKGKVDIAFGCKTRTRIPA